MASKAYKEGAAILLWWDETEGGDTDQFTMPFIVIGRRRCTIAYRVAVKDSFPSAS